MDLAINSHGGVGATWTSDYRPSRYDDWPALPDPLVVCTRCEQHAAVYGGGDRPGEFFCGPCGGHVSIFAYGQVSADTPVQQRADLEIRRRGIHDLLGHMHPHTWEGGD